MASTRHQMNSPNQPYSPPSSNFNTIFDIIHYDPILSSFFQHNCPPDSYWKMVHQLMLDGIRYRTDNQFRKLPQKQITTIKKTSEKPKEDSKEVVKLKKQDRKLLQEKHQIEKDKHYNVSYIKHNRFLSPSQKKLYITPKITETIPINSGPLVIYGKPKVKIDNQCGCPYHNNQQQCLREQSIGRVRERQKRNSPHQIHVLQSQRHINTLSKYKSSPNLDTNTKQFGSSNTKKKNERFNEEYDKTKKNEAHERGGDFQQVVYVDKIVGIEARVPGKMKVVQSPKGSNTRLTIEQSQPYLRSKYVEGKDRRLKGEKKNQIESKIKFLIQRDKKSKAIQKKMNSQDARIKQLENLMQDKKKKEKKQKIKIVSDQILSLSSSSSEMSMVDSQLVNKYKKKFDQSEESEVAGGPHFGMTAQRSQFSDEGFSNTLNNSQSQLSNQNIESQSSFSQFKT